MIQHELLEEFLAENEEWLMERILHYARQTGFTAYTSTLKEAWRLSISGLTSSVVLAGRTYDQTPDLSPEDDFQSDPVSRFGVLEAKRHRKRGISLAMFLALFKYYRSAYEDLVNDHCPDNLERETTLAFLSRVFDIIEIAFTVEWAGGNDDVDIKQLQVMNRRMTNEKNKYLTIFESLPSPAFLINSDGIIENMNFMAKSYCNREAESGGYYYTKDEQLEGRAEEDIQTPERGGKSVRDTLPWLQEEFDLFVHGGLEQNPFIKNVDIYKKGYTFVVRFSELFDVSKKFDGVVVILEDITRLEQVEKEVRLLADFIPICSHCKKIRDDKGYWSKLEKYIEERSDALFSHSICDDCLEEHYGISDDDEE